MTDENYNPEGIEKAKLLKFEGPCTFTFKDGMTVEGKGSFSLVHYGSSFVNEILYGAKVIPASEYARDLAKRLNAGCEIGPPPSVN